VQTPRAGLRVFARSSQACAIKETVEATTGPDGSAALVLGQYVASPPRKVEPQPGVNDLTPHDIEVFDGDKLLYRVRNYHVFAKGQVLELN
jgi:hypothetical protein